MKLGNYELVGKLATGGMAEVFLARLTGARGFSKDLVIKRMLPHLAENPQYVDMFLAEAQLAAKLSHPNLVQIFDFGEADGACFIAMEYVDGVEAGRLVTDGQGTRAPLDPVVAARIISLACEGLAYVHDFADPATGAPLHLVHRDVSPDNLLVSRQGTVKVVDFGIAKPSQQRGKTRTGLVKGKLSYMPPEQLRAQGLDRRTDVYALGATLFELVSGGPPYDDPVDTVVMSAILEEPVPSIRSRRTDAPAELQEIFDRCLAKEKEQRYPSCRELQEALEAFIRRHHRTVPASELAQLVSAIPRPAPRPVGPNEVARRPGSGTVEMGSAPTEAREPPTAGAVPQRPGAPSPFAPSAFAEGQPELEPWEPPSYGLGADGSFSGPEQPRSTGSPAFGPHQPSAPAGLSAFEPPPPSAEPLELGRELHKPREGELWQEPAPEAPRSTRRLQVPAAALILFAALGAGGYLYLFRPRTLQSMAAPSSTMPMVITSEPTGAAVLINGTRVGETPWAGDNLYPRGKPMQVTLTAKGFRPWTGTFQGGDRVVLEPKLKPLR